MSRKRTGPNVSNYEQFYNKKYNFWTIIDFSHSKRYTYTNKTYLRPYVNAMCDCGNIQQVCLPDILNGKNKKCSTCRIDKAYRLLIKHNENLGQDGRHNPNWRGTREIPHTYFSQIRDGAARRKIEFNLSIEDLQKLWHEQNGKCIYSGISLKFMSAPKRKVYYKNVRKTCFSDLSIQASLDRINPINGYVVGNVQWCSGTINIMKNALNGETFLEIIKLIYNHSIK